MYLPSISAAAALCCYAAVAAAAVLLLAAAVRHRATGDTICCCNFLHLIPVFSFSIHKRLKKNVPLGSSVACTASIYLEIIYILSVIAGMRGAKAGVSPPRRTLLVD